MTENKAENRAENRKDADRVFLKDKEIILVGTAHISSESVKSVEEIILEEKPDHVCVEIDASRYSSLTQKNSWENLKIDQVLKQKKGFLLLANLALSSFQKRLGLDMGTTPGEEMKKAIDIAQREGIGFSFSDREIHVTLRRAWAKSSFWGKNKMLAALLSSVFTKEKITAEELERLKNKDMLADMMEELASFLPSVKEVLIDERDRYLAAKIYERPEKKIVAVVGAGHVQGIKGWFKMLEAGSVSGDLGEIEKIPPPGVFSKIVPWVIPFLVAGLIVAGFFTSGWQEAVNMLWKWVLVNGTLSALGSLIALAHPVTILLSFLAAPVTSMNPTIGVGIVTGLTEWYLRKPRVIDFESLSKDLMSVKGFYKNRIIHVLVVFFLSSIGSTVGTFIGIPYLTSLLA